MEGLGFSDRRGGGGVHSFGRAIVFWRIFSLYQFLVEIQAFRALRDLYSFGPLGFKTTQQKTLSHLATP